MSSKAGTCTFNKHDSTIVSCWKYGSDMVMVQVVRRVLV